MVARPKNVDSPDLTNSIFDKTNLTNFSDAVIAIAITLLVLDLKLPAIQPENVDATLVRALITIFPHLTGFVLSFFVIAYYWYSYHRFMKYVRSIDTIFTVLNVLFIFFIVFLPFPTSMLGAFPARLSVVVFYSVFIASIGAVTFLMRLYAWKLGRLVDEADIGRLKSMSIQPFVSTVIYLATIPVAFVSPIVSMCMWAIAPVIYGGIHRWLHRPQKPIAHPAHYLFSITFQRPGGKN